MLIKLLSTLFLAALDQFLCVACAHPLSLIEYFECNFVGLTGADPPHWRVFLVLLIN